MTKEIKKLMEYVITVADKGIWVRNAEKENMIMKKIWESRVGHQWEWRWLSVMFAYNGDLKRKFSLWMDNHSQSRLFNIFHEFYLGQDHPLLQQPFLLFHFSFLCLFLLYQFSTMCPSLPQWSHTWLKLVFYIHLLLFHCHHLCTLLL